MKMMYFCGKYISMGHVAQALLPPFLPQKPFYGLIKVV